MTPAEITRQIRAMGWETSEKAASDLVAGIVSWKRATCGNFNTPWRDDWQTVLADVQALKQKSESKTE